MSNKDILRLAAFYILPLAIIYGGVHTCNRVKNTRYQVNESYMYYSESFGFVGHKDIAKYADNSVEVKVYPSYGHRYNSSISYRDSDGDGLVDIIRVNGSEWTMNKLQDIFVREFDYNTHKKEFDKGDILIKELGLKATRILSNSSLER